MSALLNRANAIIKLVPAADYSAKTGYLVTFSGDTGTVISSATAARPAGVILEPPATSGTTTESMTVGILGSVSGTIKMKAGGTITKGAYLTAKSDGTVVSSTGTSGHFTVGVALESAVADDLFEVAPCAPFALP